MLSSLLSRFTSPVPTGPDPAQIAAFWDWFSTNQSEFGPLLEQPERLVTMISPHLDRVDPGLSFEVGSPAEGVMHLVLSADGVRQTMPVVEALIADAPQIPGWRITAYRPPRRNIEAFLFAGQTWAPDDFWYAGLMAEDEAHLDLVLAVADRPERDDEQTIGAAFLLLDSVIGEQLVMTRIGAIDFAKVPAADLSQGQGFKPLSELRREIQDRFGVEVPLD